MVGVWGGGVGGEKYCERDTREGWAVWAEEGGCGNRGVGVGGRGVEGGGWMKRGKFTVRRKASE